MDRTCFTYRTHTSSRQQVCTETEKWEELRSVMQREAHTWKTSQVLLKRFYLQDEDEKK